MRLLPLAPALALALSPVVAAPAPVSAAPAPAPAAQHAAAVRPAATRVLAISIDGLDPRALHELGRRGSPAFHRLMRQGAVTLNARTERERTTTLPNHASMMTGRRVRASKGGHGVTWDDDRPRATVEAAAGHRVRSIFNVVHRAGGATALFSTKPKFGLYRRSWPNAIDRYVADENQRRLVAEARHDLVHRDRAFTFLHVSLPDRAGHADGFMSPQYVTAVRRTDDLLAGVLRSVDQHARLRRHLVVVLTADHGGIGTDHSDSTRRGNYRIPFLAWGPGVRRGDLYARNPGRRDPGRAQHGYSGSQPIRNGDLADLSAGLLGLGPVPGSGIGRAQDLAVG